MKIFILGPWSFRLSIKKCGDLIQKCGCMFPSFTAWWFPIEIFDSADLCFVTISHARKTFARVFNLLFEAEMNESRIYLSCGKNMISKGNVRRKKLINSHSSQKRSIWIKWISLASLFWAKSKGFDFIHLTLFTKETWKYFPSKKDN